MAKKLLFLELIFLVSLFIIIGCAPASPEKEFSNEGDLALAGQATALGCTTRTVQSCRETSDGVKIVTSVGTRVLVDICSLNKALNYSCVSARSYQQCSYQCGESERCQVGQCVSLCGNGIVDSGETCNTCPVDVSEPEVCDNVDNDCDNIRDGIMACNTTENCGSFGNACAEGYLCREGIREGICSGNCTSESILVTLNEGQTLSTVKPMLTATDLPGLLRGSIVENNLGFSDTQQQLSFTSQNSGFINNNPFFMAVGFTIVEQIAKYNLSFNLSWSSRANLSDFRDNRLQLLGREYVVTRAAHPVTAPELGIILRLMSGEMRDTLLEGETRTYVANGRAYNTTLTFIDADECKFMVNGERTNKLKVGDSYVLSDRTEIGLSDMLYQNYTSGIHSCTFFLGAQRIELRDDQITDEIGTFVFKDGSEDVDGTTVIIKGTSTEERFTIDSIEVEMGEGVYYFVGLRQLLSDAIREAYREREVLFTNNWDMRFNEYNNATNSGVVEIGKICPR